MSIIFSFLYEIFCGENTDSPEYRDSIFNSVGLLTIFIALIICLLFYLVLGRWKNVWYKLIHWVITIILLAIICFSVAYGIAKSEIGYANGYLIKFAIFNALFSIFYFIGLSFICKQFSIFSKHTPF